MSVIRKGRPFPSDGLVQALTKGLTEDMPIYRHKLYASDAASCPRRAVLFQNVPEDAKAPTNASGKLYMSIGSAIHHRVQEGFEKAGILETKEWRVNPLGINLGGFIDAIVCLNDDLRIVEVKTCGKLPSQPKYDHRNQAAVYALATGILRPIVFYVSRDVATWGGELLTRQFEIDTGEDLLVAVAGRLAESHVYSAAKKLPQIPSHFSSRDCDFCPFKHMCWGEAELPIAPPHSEQRDELDAKVEELASHWLNTLAERHDETERMLVSGETHGKSWPERND